MEIQNTQKNSDILLDKLTVIRKRISDLQKQAQAIKNTPEYQQLLQDILDNLDVNSDAAKPYVDKFNKYCEVFVELENLEKEEKELSKEYNDTLNAENREKEKNDIANSGLSEADYYNKKAVKTFGTTYDAYTGAYILTDGRLLNFDVGNGTSRQDHRFIGQIFDNCEYGKSYIRFMNYGNIRLMAETPGIELIHEPTSQQYSKISAIVLKLGWTEQYFAIDIVDTNGFNLAHRVWEGSKVNSFKIVASLKDYFAGNTESWKEYDEDMSLLEDYKYFMPNPAGYIKGECVCRAFCKITGRTYEEVNPVIREICQDGPIDYIHVEEYMEDYMGIKNAHALMHKIELETLVEDFMNDHPTGVYFMLCHNKTHKEDENHAIALVNGDVYDAFNSLDYNIYYYYDLSEAMKNTMKSLKEYYSPSVNDDFPITEHMDWKRLEEMVNAWFSSDENYGRLRMEIRPEELKDGLDDKTALDVTIKLDGKEAGTFTLDFTKENDTPIVNVKDISTDSPIVNYSIYDPRDLAQAFTEYFQVNDETEIFDLNECDNRALLFHERKSDECPKCHVKYMMSEHGVRFCPDCGMLLETDENADLDDEVSINDNDNDANVDDDSEEEYCYDDGGCDSWGPSYRERDYSPSNPWDAPGMSVGDFIRGVSVLDEGEFGDVDEQPLNGESESDADDYLPKTPRINSFRTSLANANSGKLPALFNHFKEKFVPGTKNLDYGCGDDRTANRVTTFLNDLKVENSSYDAGYINPKTGEEESHYTDTSVLTGNTYDSVTLSNVLNTDDVDGQQDMLKNCAHYLKPNGMLYVSIHEGSGKDAKSGVGTKTTCGWQERKSTGDYIPEIEKYFTILSISGKFIEARKK